jgi:hypothetical protein
LCAATPYPVNGPIAEESGSNGRPRQSLVHLFLTLSPVAAPFALHGASMRLDFEQKENKIRTIDGQEGKMLDLVQDVVSLVAMSAFLMTMAMWIGAM